jgi:hypothetical protein
MGRAGRGGGLMDDKRETPPTMLHWQDPETGLVDVVEFDVVPTQLHEDILEITSHPVEQGAEMVDHAREQPTRLMLEGFVSTVPKRGIDTDAADQQVEMQVNGFTSPGTQSVKLNILPPKPRTLSGLISAGISRIGSDFGGVPRATFRGVARRARQTLFASFYKQSSSRNRVRDVYEKLLRAQSTRALITVQTPLREHFDMMLERVPAQQNDDTGTGATFEIDLRRIRVADTQKVQSPEPAERRGAEAQSGGSKNPKPDPNAEAKEEVHRSVLVRIGKAALPTAG